MRQLVAEGLVEQIVPVAYGEEIEELSEGFLSYIRQELENPRRQHSRQGSPYSSRRTSIHLEKMGSISEELVELGVAQHEHYPWFAVETWAANAFMFLLTSRLGKLAEIDAVPVTNVGDAQPTFSATPNEHEAFERRVRAARRGMFETLLPAPVETPNVLEVLRFKERYGHLLHSFRRGINQASIEIANIKDPIYRMEYASQKEEEFREDVQRVSEAMRARWTNVVFYKLSAVLPAAIGTAYHGATGSYPGLVTSGVSLVTNVVNAMFRRSDLFDKPEPMAYVAQTQKAFRLSDPRVGR